MFKENGVQCDRRVLALGTKDAAGLGEAGSKEAAFTGHLRVSRAGSVSGTPLTTDVLLYPFCRWSDSCQAVE